MSRVIVVAATAFAIAALVLHRAVFNAQFAEPMLLLTMGSFFLLAARVSSMGERQETEPAHEEVPQPVLVPERQRASA